MSTPPTAKPVALKTVHSDLVDYLIELTRSSFSRILRDDRHVVESEEVVGGSHSAVMQLAGKDLKIHLRSDFDVDPTILLGSLKTQSFANEELHKEHLNTVAGDIQSILDKHGVKAEMSLPQSFKNDVSTDKTQSIQANCYKAVWSIKGPDFSFGVEVAIEVVGNFKLDDLKVEKDSLSKPGTIINF